MSGADAEPNDVERLRTLLFGDQPGRLSDTEARLEKLESWIGDAPRLETAAARVLVEAFKRAEIERHRDLALAVAPVVVAAIRAEIVNSKDMMVEALYPIAGRMVTAAVANAFRELIAGVNQRIDALTSTEQWRLRVKSLATGRSVAEVALAEARGARCVRAMLIERGGGRLLAQWRPQGATDDNPNLIGGLIAAITEFASTVFADRRGELRNLDLGSSRIYLRASSRVILAAEMVGAVTREQEHTIDARFLALVDRNDRGDALADSDLADVATPTARKPAKTRRLRWIVIGLIAAICLGLALRGPVYRWRKGAEIDEAFHSAQAADARLAAYPLAVREDWTARTVELSGLAPSRDEVRKLVEAIAPAAAPLVLLPHVEVVAPAEGLEAMQARVADLAASLAAEGDQAKAIADRLGAAEKATAALRADLASKFEAVNADIAKTAAGAASALGAEAAALRSRSAKIEAGLKDSVETERVEDGAIAELGRNLGALRARLEDVESQAETAVGDLRTKASRLSEHLTALQSASADTARKLEATSAQARDNAAKAEDAHANVLALDSALAAARAEVAANRDTDLKATAASLDALKPQLAQISTALGAVKANETATEARLADEARRLRDEATAAAELKRRVEALSTDETRQADHGKAAIDEMAAKVAVARQTAADARSEIDELRARVDAATRSVPEVARRSIIYFGDGDTLVDPAAAAAVADRLAEAIKRSGEGVRVIGYADEFGVQAANGAVSEARADKVMQMLIERGVPASKAIPVGRAAQNAVVAGGAAGSRNRRVVFEPLFPGEAP